MALTHTSGPQVLAMGEAMVEFNQSPDDPRQYLQGFGGDTSNFAIAARRQGVNTGFVSALGDDRFGRMLLDLWREEAVDTDAVRVDAQAPTGVYFVSHDASGHHFDYLRAGSAASRYRPQDLPREALASASFLHLSGISLAISASACDAAFEAMSMIRAAGGKVSFDTNLRLKLWPLARARATMREAFSLTDVCLPSWDDVTAVTGLDDRDAILDALLSYGVKVVALKLGREGCYVATPDERRIVAPYPVKAVDATGAGDCFGGAFVARLALGEDPFAAARYANVCAALSTTGYGAVAPVPRAEQVLQTLAG
ncbi:2-dehydro-3-deoxygluconokinase [Pandoraea cepalis]|uniref:2-dehydro-3-deoxygluconokinase n=1 Tax=Pandoraea cepalis TaxID=2508294 RepID=A0A5E4XNK6_9BURK|nr:sugar kinase [Pandoraea cepalis]VVE37957.1 2-dehydro-3-deoxygluconokinase [Pandoraea cepalis]